MTRTEARTREVGQHPTIRRCRLRAIERIVPEHFNPAADQLTPRTWEIEVVEGLPCELDEFRFLAVAFSRKEAEKGLLSDLRRAGLSGVVRIRRAA